MWAREGEPPLEVKRVLGFKPLPKRWAVEETFAWMGHSRRFAQDYEVHPEATGMGMYLSVIHLLVRRLARAA